MKDASIKILDKLKKSGYRITKARKEVAMIMAKSNQPLPVSSLAEKTKADEASVYRIVALLLELGLIEELNFPGQKNTYAIKDGHHHHVVCTKCNLVRHLEGGAEPKAPRLVPGFATINDHELTFYGLCAACGKM